MRGRVPRRRVGGVPPRGRAVAHHVRPPPARGRRRVLQHQQSAGTVDRPDGVGQSRGIRARAAHPTGDGTRGNSGSRCHRRRGVVPPPPNYTGTAVITVRAMDTAGGVATARLRVVVTPRKLTIASRPGSTGQVPTAIRAAVVTSPTAICPSPSAGGPAVAFMTVGAVTVPVKAVTMSTAGVLEPPASSRVAAVSPQHADLDADHGTSVLVWHSRFGQGCPGSLNPLLRQPIGTTFSVRTGTGMTRTYRIDQTAMVPQGRYRSAWFAQDGPHRLSLFTCSGLTSGRFTSTAFIHAVEVANGDS